MGKLKIAGDMGLAMKMQTLFKRRPDASRQPIVRTAREISSAPFSFAPPERAWRAGPRLRYMRAMVEAIRRIFAATAAAQQRFVAQHADELARVVQVTVDALARGRTLFFFGNGGSASDAQHLAAEFVLAQRVADDDVSLLDARRGARESTHSSPLITIKPGEDIVYPEDWWVFSDAKVPPEEDAALSALQRYVDRTAPVQ